MTLRNFLEIAIRGQVIRRAFILAVIVGTLLVAINHGRCLLRGKFDSYCLMSCILTFLVPYCVSTVSSVLAAETD